jgi:hypothetical protein
LIVRPIERDDVFGVASLSSPAATGIAQVWISAQATWLLLLGVVVWWLYSRSSGRGGRRRSRPRTTADPAYGVAAGSLDLRDDREGPLRRRGGRFEHEVVGRRGEDLVVEVEDDRRSARFLVRTTRKGERLVSPADSVDRHHDEAWIGAVREYLRTTGSPAEPETARE